MRRAAIDIGNTRIKCALFDEQGRIISRMVFDFLNEVNEWLQKEQVKKAIVSSVGRYQLQKIPGLDLITLDHRTKTPFKNLYTTPETLGVDRVAAMAAACTSYPGQAVLVFDVGTCMTIDLMHPDQTYKGGNISPGLDMRLRAMQSMTDRLPYSSHKEATDAPGHSTLSALANGVMWGMRFEMDGYISHFREIYPDLVVVGCGGDISHFDKQLKFKIFAAPDFVLQGLYELLLLNEN